MARKASVGDRCCRRLGILDAASPVRVNDPIVLVMAAFHALAVLACLPWLFTWSGLGWFLVGPYLFGTLGVNVCYHRLLTHRGFACPAWLEHGLSILGVCCWQGTPVKWVAVHRMHHQNSDEATDPHSPGHSFFWGHMGWFMVIDPAVYNLGTIDRFARDLIRDPFYKWLERRGVHRMIQWCQWLAFLGAGALVGGLTTWTALGALQVGLSWLVWGVILRTVVVWHITWSVNSVTHLWGYRTYNTADDSRNNWLVGLLSNGEGWHNNHHADPRCAAHGLRWWEFDVSFLTILALSWVGLAKDLMPSRHVKDPLPATDPLPMSAAPLAALAQSDV